jgi:hypothetical protein
MAHTRDTSVKPDVALLGGRQLPVLNSDPTTTYWGEQEAGILWFSKNRRKWRFWDGTAIREITST